MPRYRGSGGGVGAAPKDRPRIGILLSNLGSPDDPSPVALRRYLREFLSDPRVVELPRPAWWLILNLFILPLRPFRVSKLYRRIWTDDGSPLLALTRRLADGVRRDLDRGESWPVVVGMRYGRPAMADALAELVEQGCGRIVHLPLYPQYSASTTGTNVDALSAAVAEYRWVPDIRHVASYHTHPRYIGALANSVRAVRSGEPAGRRLLMSFHGIPERYAKMGDPYPAYCRETAEALATELDLSAEGWAMTFQSRFGREPWLQPYTDEILKQWGREAVDGVDVICPGFAVDCLETLEEIEKQNREIFTRAGGESFRYIAALNDSLDHVRLVAQLARESATGWSTATQEHRP
jgi:protoporphyrin/coproporphyrin ferrochelatase